MRKSRQDSLYSQQYIMEALSQLLEENDLEDITITDICKKAGVARVTFYKYYHSIYDVMNANVEVTVKSLIERHVIPTPYKDIRDVITNMMEELAANPTALKRQIDTNMSGILLDYFIYAIDKLAQSDAFFNKDMDRASVLFVAGGMFSVITDWFKHDLKESPQSIAANITAVLPGSVLKKE
ncbi:TetR/AcrR family transcriptional regulator [Terribacillus sp. DMT04]|uniref:TetR/AcrR family transcriptional regulator n=1 Tax=Terribacillus sp. DMT04 TaxID=2850441 RepID=UPI001C2B923E|nr:TetR/AcrR family transcriptional regulator [Terribacillus sp. DMT04]QXE02578.1 TetR/AcrR family transcriptional regulator [Terribacillus sp. DMT04]